MLLVQFIAHGKLAKLLRCSVFYLHLSAKNNASGLFNNLKCGDIKLTNLTGLDG